jgi:hypothetical protein
MLSFHISGVLGFTHPKEQAKNLSNRRGLSHYCPLPLVALGGEECGAAALLSSTGP